TAEAAEAFRRISERGVATNDALEQLARSGDVAGALAEVGERVPEPEVARLGSLGVWRLLEQGDGALEVSAVGKGARSHDPPLVHQVGARRRLAQLVPQLRDPGPALEGPVAV